MNAILENKPSATSIIQKESSNIIDFINKEIKPLGPGLALFSIKPIVKDKVFRLNW